MAVLKSLAGIKSLKVASLSSVVELSNYNFSTISTALSEFLTSINYLQGSTVSISIPGITANTVAINQSLIVYNNNNPVINLSSTGSVTAKNVVSSDVLEGLRLRLIDYGSLANPGYQGEIVYISDQPGYVEGFYGYLNSTGWTPLSGGSGTGGSGPDIGDITPAMVMMYTTLQI